MDLRTVASGVWTALSADRLTFAFTLTMLAVFLMALPYHVLRASTGTISFARSAPKMLVSVGVLGTLAALFTTLLAFDTSARDASLPSLVEGLRASAATGLRRHVHNSIYSASSCCAVCGTARVGTS